MISFEKRNNDLILIYEDDMNGDASWVYNSFKSQNYANITVFKVTPDDLLAEFDEDELYAHLKFKLGEKSGSYFRINRDKFKSALNNNLFIHESITLNRKTFIAHSKISVINKIDNILNDDLYIGGDHPEALPAKVFKKLQDNFPNTTELAKYAEARVDSVVSSYLETKKDYEDAYNKYLSNKPSRTGEDIQQRYFKVEIDKYQSILAKLNQMIQKEDEYTESQWQKELLDIILLLYPKYIYVFTEAPVKDSYKNTTRNIDYLLVDSTGNVDIIEIKKPFDKCIVTERTYRDNHIPLRELSGTVMQIEKYIFHLSKWGKKGEDKLTEKYKDIIGDDFKIKIINPKGIIIMGRTEGLSSNQIDDFEVIKRKYNNIIDIMTYDDLINRLNIIMNTWISREEPIDQAPDTDNTLA